MANIIATLENKNGDTIYPVAGAMASDSISTAMLQDGSVTADKIDFAAQISTDDGITITKFGNHIIGDVNLTSTSAISVSAYDASPYQVTTLSDAPQHAISVPVWAMNASNAQVTALFLEISTGGIVRIRNYTANNVSFTRLRAQFSFVAS